MDTALNRLYRNALHRALSRANMKLSLKPINVTSNGYKLQQMPVTTIKDTNNGPTQVVSLLAWGDGLERQRD